MNWPFRRRGGSSADRPSGPARPADATAAPAAAQPAPPAAWRQLPPLAGPLTAARPARGLTSAPVTDRTVREAGSMLATAAATGRTGAPGAPGAPVGRVEGLARAVPLRHVEARRIPQDAVPEPAGPPGLPTAVLPPLSGAPAPDPVQPAFLPPAEPPAPVARRAAPAPAAAPVVDLTRVTEGSVGEPRRATVSTHPPTFMNAGAIGPDTDLAALFFPLPGDAPVFAAPPAAEPEPEPGGRRAHLTQRRNLGQSRRLGLGTPLSHPAGPEQAAPGEGEGRPPPAAESFPPPSAPQTAPQAGPDPVAAALMEHRTEPPSAPPPPGPGPAQHADGPAGPPAPAADRPRPALHHRATRPAPALEAPADLARAVSELHGVDVTGTPLHTGEQATRMAQDLSAKAFTKNAEVYLPDSASSLDSARTRGLIAHELTHVAQQKRYGGSLPPEDSPAGRALEAEAISAERYFRGDPGTPAPLVHRRPVTSGPDPEEIRRLIAQLAPVPPPPPPPAPAPAPAPEPEPAPAPEPEPEPVHAGPDVSWTAGAGLLDGVQRASREEIVEEYLKELNHARRHGGDGRAALTSADVLNNTEHMEIVNFRDKRQFGKGTRDQIINEFLAEKNYELRHKNPDAPPLTSLNLQTDLTLRDAIDFRLEEAARTGRLVPDDNDDHVVETQDVHWLKGQVGLSVVQGLASGFGVNLDSTRRSQVRNFFAGRPAAAAEGSEDDGVFGSVGTSGPHRSAASPGSPDPGEAPAAGPSTGKDPAAPPQPSVKAAGANNGTSAQVAAPGPTTGPPPAAQPFTPSVGPSEDGPGPGDTAGAAGSGTALWNEVKSSLWTAATTGFLHPPAPADEEKKAPDEASGKDAPDAAPPAVFEVDALGEDQLDALAHRLYGRVRDRWNSDQRRASAVHRERNGTKYR
ncbi:DUF4157 domain-containing protein [Streptomyces sp. NPDC089919]|uniref:eCIS core domain-containing protein n=1 Tax=Streptomyces sp. NPDC089919 TaxID=3155188 RepID=UPI0034212F48